MLKLINWNILVINIKFSIESFLVMENEKKNIKISKYLYIEY